MSMLFVFAPAALFGGIIELIGKWLTRPRTYRPGMVQRFI